MPPRKAAKKTTKTSRPSRSKKGEKLNDDSNEPAELAVEEPSMEEQTPQTLEPAVPTGSITPPPASPPSNPTSEAQHTEPELVIEETATAAAKESGTDVQATNITIQDRAAKLDALRMKMRETAQANRKDLIAEHQQHKTTARDLARLEKQRKLAEALREKVDAEEKGLDSERKKNWEYTIEENDAWEKIKKRKARRADFEYHDDVTTTHRKYKKDLDLLRPDLAAYNRQKEAALGLPPGTLVRATESGQQVVVASSSQSQQLAAEDLYRDANSLIYGDNKPSEEAIDRVVAKLNKDLDKRGKFSRKRLNEDEGDITYINERNRVFNKKIARYYDKYTAEIRASFERGTAL